MPSPAIAPVAQHRGRDAQLPRNLDQFLTAARHQGVRLRLELIRTMTPFLTHSTPSRSSRSFPNVSTNPGEAHSAASTPQLKADEVLERHRGFASLIHADAR